MHIAHINLQAFLIDGYPLDEAQANDFVSDIGPPTVVVCLEIPDEVVLPLGPAEMIAARSLS